MADDRLAAIRAELGQMADPRRARDLQWFFKTGPGEYGAGDIFLGIRVPALRRMAAKHRGLTLSDANVLLRSSFHEERLLALFILSSQYARGDRAHRARIYALYTKNLRHINNWDLVDCSAPHIVGCHLYDRSRRPLRVLARSRSLWKRRVAVLATFYYIRRGDFSDAFEIADMLLADPEDLIHKAVGWMLREAGNRSPAREEEFLKTRYRRMPRTMLRYAIEKFPEEKRQRYLRGEA